MQVNFEDIQAVANQIKTIEAERDALAKQNLELRGALELAPSPDEFRLMAIGMSGKPLYGAVQERAERYTAAYAVLALPLPAAAERVAAMRKAMEDAEGLLRSIWVRIPAKTADTPLTRTVEFSDQQVGELYDVISTLRAARGGK
jgi:hypothetical protein